MAGFKVCLRFSADAVEIKNGWLVRVGDGQPQFVREITDVESHFHDEFRAALSRSLVLRNFNLDYTEFPFQLLPEASDGGR